MPWCFLNTNSIRSLQEIVVSRGKTLELLKPDPNTGKVHTLLSAEVFGIVRSLMSFRLTGGGKASVFVSLGLSRISRSQPSK